MKANKKVMAALLAAMMTVSAGAAVVSAATIVDGPGSTISSTTKGTWYADNVVENGKVVTKYAYKEAGSNEWVTGWKLIDGKWYYFDLNSAYAKADGEYKLPTSVGERWFRFDKNCAMVTGWYQDVKDTSDPTETAGNGWHFYDYNTGIEQTGWIKDGANWFYITKGTEVKDVTAGTLLMNGTYVIDNVNYTFAANGVLVNEGHGWVKDSGLWFWVQEDGTRFKGAEIEHKGKRIIDARDNKSWNLIHGKYYLFDDDGVMQTGWKEVATAANVTDWYYMTSNGDCILNNWIRMGNGDWYLTNASGAMVTGWTVRGGKTYYLNDTISTLPYGVMATGTQTINGKTCVFDASGALVSINGQPVTPENTPAKN